MNRQDVNCASKPPSGITGLQTEWSRLIEVRESDGKTLSWHLLDSWSTKSTENPLPKLTLLCVHGNPSWSFLWRRVISSVPESVRVIAVDQLDMGFSERTGVKRTLAMRINDLCLLTDTLGLQGPVVTLAHDWGGPISLGWALRHLKAHKICIAGVALCNTAVHQPESSSAPAVIRLIRSKLLLNSVTVRSKAFITGAIKMSAPALPRDVVDGFYAPYQLAQRRKAIADFVQDIPLDNDHVSATTLDSIANSLHKLSDVPALLLWGPRDKVFSDLYLHDLEQRLPHAQVHRYPLAAHFVSEDADIAGAVRDWLKHIVAGAEDAQNAGSAKSAACAPQRALADFSAADKKRDAVVELAPERRSISFGKLTREVDTLASGMAAFGIRAGDRVAVMILPGIDLVKVVYACWRLGALLVLVDSGLGRDGMQRALKSANPAYLIGIDKALIAARVLGWPGLRVSLSACSALKRSLLAVSGDLDSIRALATNENPLPWPDADSEAALVFTSGSTGPSKGVIYNHGQIQAQRDSLMKLYKISGDDRLVAAFAPFALYAPAMGITSIVPEMDVTRPASLSAKALARAVSSINATLVFASPAALVNVNATRNMMDAQANKSCASVRLVLSAGAPVRAALLESMLAVFSSADFHTPYGMTEVLPVADISLAELQTLPVSSAGVCVGFPVAGVQVFIDPLDLKGELTGELSSEPNTMGEIVIRAAHSRLSYDRLWHTTYLASLPEGVHRSGDIGQLDEDGRLWVGGRSGHVIVTAEGPVAPVATEQLIETLNDIDLCAVVGVGPSGSQRIVAVVQMKSGIAAQVQSPLPLLDAVRDVVAGQLDITAVLVAGQLPVDRRHNSKIDRTRIARWASSVLAGNKAGQL